MHNGPHPAADVTAASFRAQPEVSSISSSSLESGPRLQTFTAALLEATTPAEVVATVLEHGMAVLHAEAGVIVLISADGQYLEMVGARGYAPDMREHWGRFPLSPPAEDPLPLSDAVREATTLFFTDRADWVERYPVMMQRITRVVKAAVSLPLIGREKRAFGGLHFSFAEERPGGFVEADRAFLAELARQCALALDRALLLEETRRARDEAEAAQLRQRYLAEAGVLLGASLGYQATLEAIARLAVPTLADWCIVDILNEAATGIERVVTAHVDPAKEEAARAYQERYPIQLDAPSGLGRVLRTGEPELYSEIPEAAIEAAARDDEHREFLRAAGLTSMMCAPLIVRGRVFGAITFVATRESERHYGMDDLAMAEELARRAAAAVDNARLYHAAQNEVVERKEAEEALRISEERYRLLTLATNQIVWWTDAAGIIVKPAPLWGGFTGQTAAEYHGWGWLEAVHPEDRAAAAAAWRGAVAEQRFYEYAYRLRYRDGSYRHMLVRSAPILDEEGKAVEWIGANTDITEQVEAEEREQFLSDLLDRTRFLSDPGEIIHETVVSVGTFLDVGRCLLAEIDAAGTVTLHEDYVRASTDLPPLTGKSIALPWDRETEIELRAGLTVVRHDDFAEVIVPLLQGNRWVAAFSARTGGTSRNWTQDEVDLLETVTQQMWLTVENARLRLAEKEAAARQRSFLREMLFGLTEGRLRLCDTEADLPAALPPVSEEVELSTVTLRVLRKQVEEAARVLHLSRERIDGLVTAVNEAAANAVRHADSGTGRVHADPTAGVLQVWIQDNGEGIAEHLIHRAIEQGWTTGGFGSGFFLMLRTADRVYLLTNPTGTTVVLEQDREPPIPTWMRP